MKKAPAIYHTFKHTYYSEGSALALVFSCAIEVPPQVEPFHLQADRADVARDVSSHLMSKCRVRKKGHNTCKILYNKYKGVNLTQYFVHTVMCSR